MTKKHFKAFADYIADLRQTATEHSNIEGESDAVYDRASECEHMVIKISKEFNPKFKEEKFKKACQPKS